MTTLLLCLLALLVVGVASVVAPALMVEADNPTLTPEEEALAQFFAERRER